MQLSDRKVLLKYQIITGSLLNLAL